MSGPTWIEIRASLPSIPEDWSLFAEAFDRHGCPGSQVEDNAIFGYLADVAGADAVSKALGSDLTALGATVSVGRIEEQDWSELWKIHFKPRRVGERLILRPTWEPYACLDGDVEIVLDPGQAFGTGDHPTTRLCLQLLENALAANPDVKVADVGCGSGVLAIAAAKLGATVTMASDLDPISVEVTRLNANLNGVDFPTDASAGFDSVGTPVDLALSNIISATLIRLAPDAAAKVKPGGLWIVSGVIEANWTDVHNAAVRQGFTLVSKELEDEWVGATFRR